MPPVQVVFYAGLEGRAPVLEWLKELRRWDPRAYAKCVAGIERLSQVGHELRRPTADFLRDGLHELRLRRGRVPYRILYFFHGRRLAVLTHGLTKEGAVPPAEIERALRRKLAFEESPDPHTYRAPP